jgi:hypothetical protein
MGTFVRSGLNKGKMKAQASPNSQKKSAPMTQSLP